MGEKLELVIPLQRWNRIGEVSLTLEFKGGQFYFECSEKIVFVNELALEKFTHLIEKDTLNLVARALSFQDFKKRVETNFRALIFDGEIFFDDEFEEGGNDVGDDIVVYEKDERYITHPAGKTPKILKTISLREN